MARRNQDQRLPTPPPDGRKCCRLKALKMSLEDGRFANVTKLGYPMLFRTYAQFNPIDQTSIYDREDLY
jgi:hypothetical protein